MITSIQRKLDIRAMGTVLRSVGLQMTAQMSDQELLGYAVEVSTRLVVFTNMLANHSVQKLQEEDDFQDAYDEVQASGGWSIPD